MQVDPFSGDVVRLQGELHTWRRRVGNYRVFFEISADQLTVDVLGIVRRTSTTY